MKGHRANNIMRWMDGRRMKVTMATAKWRVDEACRCEHEERGMDFLHFIADMREERARSLRRKLAKKESSKKVLQILLYHSTFNFNPSMGDRKTQNPLWYYLPYTKP